MKRLPNYDAHKPTCAYVFARTTNKGYLPDPALCTCGADIEATMSELTYPQDQSNAEATLADTCPGCGTKLEYSEGLERDYPDCPKCRYKVQFCPECGGDLEAAGGQFGCTCR